MNQNIEFPPLAKTPPSNAVTHIITPLKVGDLNINITSRFYPKKSLSEILFSVVSMRFKEKLA